MGKKTSHARAGPQSAASAALESWAPPAGPSVELVPAQPGFLVAVPAFLTATECTKLIAAADGAGLQPASGADLNPRKGEAFLNREKVAFVDPGFAASLWARLSPCLPETDGRQPVGFHGDGARGQSGEFKFYRYARGHRFGLHVDQSWRGGEGEETEYTLLIYLNSSGEVRAHRCARLACALIGARHAGVCGQRPAARGR